jgi:hypothetical protein
MNEFIHLVMIGLAGSTQMKSCTCSALGSLAIEYKEIISGTLIGELIETTTLIVRGSSSSPDVAKEVVLAGLNLLKILTAIFNHQTLLAHIDTICDTVHYLHEKKQSPPSKTGVKSELSEQQSSPLVNRSQRIRALAKSILKKLVKKNGYELVYRSLFRHEQRTSSVTENATPHLPNAIKQGLENLLQKLKKEIETEKDTNKQKSKDAVSVRSAKTTRTHTNRYDEYCNVSFCFCVRQNES